MSPLAELQARYDGAIPPAELAAATAAEAAYLQATAEAAYLQAAAAPRRQDQPAAAAGILGRVRLKPEALVPLLARALVGLYAERGCATAEDLARLGFTAAEIAAHRDAASAYAAALCRARGLDPLEEAA